MDKAEFIASMQAGYQQGNHYITLGSAMLDKNVLPEARVTIPLKMFNRHGLIAGATGSGKTKTLQCIAEQLSLHGVPSLVLDIKGDLSGIAVPGVLNEKIKQRQELLNLSYQPTTFPVELLSISSDHFVRIRATVSEFGPVLFSRMLGLNDTQGGVMAVVFKYCDDQRLPLIDLEDIKKALQYCSEAGKSDFQSQYGAISPTTLGTIIRKIVELEQQGAGAFFGEPSFEVSDLLSLNTQGHGTIHVLRVNDIQDKPKLFSTLLLQLLAEIYSSFPEAGDMDKPKLCLFFDEAHLIFEEASKALLDQLETMIKLIRSKGVGVYFITQIPSDIPSEVLSQLGLKVQHTLRAFTAADRKAIKLVAQNYPESSMYDTEQLITELGIGEALVTALNDKGIPTPLAHTYLRAPESRMDILSDAEIKECLSKSKLMNKYQEVINKESAYEILSGKLEEAASEAHQGNMESQQKKEGTTKKEKSTFEKVVNSPVTKQIGRTIAREVTRGILGVLGIGGRKKRGGLF